MTHILLIEDTEVLRLCTAAILKKASFTVSTAEHGKEGLAIALDTKPDLILCDVRMPHMNGYEVLDNLKQDPSTRTIPFIFLTAKNARQDIRHGMHLGADDYLTKPFNLEELLLRVQNLLRRSTKASGPSTESYEFGGNKVDFVTFEAEGNQGAFNLTKKEAMLLNLLIDRRNEVVSRQQILQSVWGYDVYPSTRTIDNFILSFRKYFEEDPKHPKFFHSVRGVGYKFIHE